MMGEDDTHDLNKWVSKFINKAKSFIFRSDVLALSLNWAADDPLNWEYHLYAIVGYYGNHYMSYIWRNAKWYLCEDEKQKLIGTFEEMQETMEKGKTIPYLIFYEKRALSVIDTV